MKTYKWDRIIHEAENSVSLLGAGCWTSNSIALSALFQSVEQVITGEQIRSWRDNCKDITAKARSICLNWDIRRAKALFSIFPDLIAEKYRNQTPTAEYDDKGNWVLIYDN